jgi:hypothetical protein
MNPRSIRYSGCTDTRRVKLNSNSIGFLAGRPKRDIIIQCDEILNLRIELNLYNDVKDFVNNI